MNITRFTFSLALLSSVASLAIAHKPSCSSDCKHDSLRPTKSAKKSTSQEEIKNVEITDIKKEASEPIAEPVTNTAVTPAPVELVATNVVPVETTVTLEITETAPVAASKEVVSHDAPKAEALVTDDAEKASITLEEKIKTLPKEDARELRVRLADATEQDMSAADLERLITELQAENDAESAKVETKTAAAQKEESAPKEDMNNLTQVMI